MISKSELKQIIKEMLMNEKSDWWGDKPGAPTEDLPLDTWGFDMPGLPERQYVGQGEAQYSAPPTPAANEAPRTKQALHDLSDTESMTEEEYNLLYGPGAAQKKQIADIEGGGTGWVPGDVPPPTDPWYTEDEVGKTVPEERRGKEREEEKKEDDDKKDDDKKDGDKKDDKKEKKQPKKKKKKKREDAEAENEAVDAAKNELAKMAAEQQWTAEQAATKAKALASAQTLFGAMRGWGTDEAAINMALTNAAGAEGLPEVYDAYDEILQQAIRMGIADADDGDLTQWLKDDGMDEWAAQVAQANIVRRRSLAGSAAEAARTAAGEAAVKKSGPALQERTTYSSYPDQHKLFENWNKFVKLTKE